MTSTALQLTGAKQTSTHAQVQSNLRSQALLQTEHQQLQQLRAHLAVMVLLVTSRAQFYVR